MSIKRLPRNIWVLTVCQSLSMASPPLMVFVGGLLGTRLAPSPKWATLPLTAVILGTALSTVPAAMLMKRIGRKRGTYCGFIFAFLGCLLLFWATLQGAFLLFLVGAFALGINVAFAQQFRFSAFESLKDPNDFGLALSVLMLSGIVSAFIGPEIGTRGKDLIESPFGFAGSFLIMAAVFVVVMLLFAFFKDPEIADTSHLAAARPLGTIVKNPFFIVALMAGSISFGVMSFVMTATPINMHELCGFDLENTKRVIQVHIASMFLPSLLGGWLMKRFGLGWFALAGSIFYSGMLMVGLWGQELLHFWGALILLGVGWNFLFVSGTALLPRSYLPTERFKAQALNDFVVFGVQATASLGAGWFLYQYGWSALIWTCLPATLIAVMGSVWLVRNENASSSSALWR